MASCATGVYLFLSVSIGADDELIDGEGGSSNTALRVHSTGDNVLLLLLQWLSSHISSEPGAALLVHTFDQRCEKCLPVWLAVYQSIMSQA